MITRFLRLVKKHASNTTDRASTTTTHGCVHAEKTKQPQRIATFCAAEQEEAKESEDKAGADTTTTTTIFHDSLCVPRLACLPVNGEENIHPPPPAFMRHRTRMDLSALSRGYCTSGARKKAEKKQTQRTPNEHTLHSLTPSLTHSLLNLLN